MYWMMAGAKQEMEVMEDDIQEKETLNSREESQLKVTKYFYSNYILSEVLFTFTWVDFEIGRLLLLLLE